MEWRSDEADPSDRRPGDTTVNSPRRVPGRAPRATSEGRIVTFYSYKGGTGRSMAMANVAWILAANGQRVLAVDWDLEAPGLHRYFHPFLLDPELRDTEGVIDFVARFATHAVAGPPRTGEARSSEPQLDPSLADLTEYAVRVEHPFPDGGVLDLVPAGRQSAGYGAKVNSFDWQTFYDRLGGGAFLQSMRTIVRDDYDFVLIDSRTGVSDTAGVCTIELPDDLVVCFTLNGQSMEGAAAVARSVRAQRGFDELSIYPVPMRVEFAEKLRLERAREVARRQFDSFLFDVDAQERERYWGDVEVVYQPYYAYEEILAVFGDRPLQTNSVLGGVERLTARLTKGRFTTLPLVDDATRKDVIARYGNAVSDRPNTRARQSTSSVYVSYSRRNSDVVHRLVAALERAGAPYQLTTEVDTTPGSDVESRVEQTIINSVAVVAIVTPDVERSISFVRQEWELAATLGKHIIPVVVGLDTDLPPSLQSRSAIRVDPSGDSEEFRLSVSRLATAIDSAVTAVGPDLALKPTDRQVDLYVDRDSVRLVSDLDDIQVPHALRGLDAQIITLLNDVLANPLTVKSARSPSFPGIGFYTTAEVLGTFLYQTLLPGRVGMLLEQLLDEPGRDRAGVLRIRLELAPEAEALTVLPLELLHSPPGPSPDFIADRRDVRLSLGLQGAGPSRSVAIPEHEVHALVLDADPKTGAEPFMDLRSTRRMNLNVVAVDPFDLNVLRFAVSPSPLVVHVAGRFSRNGGLTSPTDASRTVAIADILSRIDPVPALVVLEDREPGGFGARRTAFSLLRTGASCILVVSVARRREASQFLNVFYENFLDGASVEDALSRARWEKRVLSRDTALVASLWTSRNPGGLVHTRWRGHSLDAPATASPLPPPPRMGVGRTHTTHNPSHPGAEAES